MAHPLPCAPGTPALPWREPYVGVAWFGSRGGSPRRTVTEVGLSSVGMESSSATTLLSTELATFVERYVAAWNDCDPDAMALLITEDIVWADPALPEPACGVEAVAQFMRDSFRAFPDLHFGEPDPRVLAHDGDVVLWGWNMRGTHRGPIDPPGFAPTGRTMHIDGVDEWHLRDGRIARYRAFYDMNELARQLGIVPEPGSRAERVMVKLQRAQARL